MSFIENFLEASSASTKTIEQMLESKEKFNLLLDGAQIWLDILRTEEGWKLAKAYRKSLIQAVNMITTVLSVTLCQYELLAKSTEETEERIQDLEKNEGIAKKMGECLALMDKIWD